MLSSYGYSMDIEESSYAKNQDLFYFKDNKHIYLLVWGNSMA